MQRGMRIGWIVLANGGVVWFTTVRLFPELLAAKDWNLSGALQFTIETILEIALPIAGIIAEIANWKHSQGLNVGYLLLASCWWLLGALFWRSDPFWGVLLIFGLGFLALTGITFVLYRATQLD